MNNINTTFTALNKISGAAKQAARNKQISYRNGDHEKTRQYKALQKDLYLLKGLTLVDLERRGIVSRSIRSYDAQHNAYLEQFVANVPGADFGCHSISANQINEPGEVVTEFSPEKRCPENHIFYGPYMYHLIQQLPPDLREIYDAITNNHFYWYFGDAVAELIADVQAIGIHTEESGWHYKNPCEETRYMTITLSYNNAEICQIKISVWDEDREYGEVEPVRDDGALIFTTEYIFDEFDLEYIL